MNSITRASGPLCLLVGAALLGVAIATGGARLYLLVFIPVVTGTTLLFGLGVGLLVVGFLLFPLVFTGDEPGQAFAIAPAPSTTDPSPDETGSGGLILFGPIPVFFGGWRPNPPISYRWALLIGGVLAGVAVLLLWGLSAL